MGKYWFEDRYFYFGGMIGLASHLGACSLLYNRFTYRAPHLPITLFMCGLWTHFLMEFRRQHFVLKQESWMVGREIKNHSKLSQHEGKFLEEKERALMEVFKTIVY